MSSTTKNFEGYDITIENVPGAIQETWQITCGNQVVANCASEKEAVAKAKTWAKEMKAKK